MMMAPAGLLVMGIVELGPSGVMFSPATVFYLHIVAILAPAMVMMIIVVMVLRHYSSQ